MNKRFQSDHALETQLSAIGTDLLKLKATVGFLNSETIFAPLLISLEQIEKLINQNIAVLIQRGLGEDHAISDYQFTEFGADIMEDELPIISLSNLILKFDPFSIDDIQFIKEKQILISFSQTESFTKEMAEIFQEKKVTAIDINFLNIDITKIQETVYQLLSLLIFSNNFKRTIQMSPLLLKSIYCYHGEICNRKIAENAGVPWKDLVELCWGMN